MIETKEVLDKKTIVDSLKLLENKKLQEKIIKNSDKSEDIEVWVIYIEIHFLLFMKQM